MKIEDCTMGKVVGLKDVIVTSGNSGNYSRIYNRDLNTYLILVGHIIGFSFNSCGETIVEVKWNNKEKTCVHPALLLDPKEKPFPTI